MNDWCYSYTISAFISHLNRELKPTSATFGKLNAGAKRGGHGLRIQPQDADGTSYTQLWRQTRSTGGSAPSTSSSSSFCCCFFFLSLFRKRNGTNSQVKWPRNVNWKRQKQYIFIFINKQYIAFRFKDLHYPSLYPSSIMWVSECRMCVCVCGAACCFFSVFVYHAVHLDDRLWS